MIVYWLHNYTCTQYITLADATREIALLPDQEIITTRVFTTTQILLSGLSRNGLTSLYCLYHGGYKIVYLEVVVLQSVEYSIAMIRLRQNGPLFPLTAWVGSSTAEYANVPCWLR